MTLNTLLGAFEFLSVSWFALVGAIVAILIVLIIVRKKQV
jgi:LPXTG-motif cell wall-anchored protein